ncbi:MAG: hypothetical protein DME30_05880 [Verrucomicrobia bacterium]|nr:MAG: hypothetical protein DME30_05880 [Verrucomicrobiota bacterium]
MPPPPVMSLPPPPVMPEPPPPVMPEPPPPVTSLPPPPPPPLASFFGLRSRTLIFLFFLAIFFILPFCFGLFVAC